MRSGSARRLLAATTICVLAWTAGAAAAEDEGRGIDANQGDSLVEIELENRAAAMNLQLEADRYGIDFNEHYLRRNSNGTVTVTVFGDDQELERLEAAGYDLGTTIEGPRSYRARVAERAADVRAERRAERAALADPVGPAPADDELVVLRVDYFENYAGRFLSVEAKNRQGRAVETPLGATYEGPSMSLSWNRGGSTPIDAEPTPMDVNLDPDTTPDTYIEHRELVRIGDVGGGPRPTRVRIGSSTGATIEAPVNVWLGGGLPPMAQGYLRDFTTRYMDPTEVYGRFDSLAKEFSNIAQLVKLPHKTNGYQRRAQATMAGTSAPGNAFPNTAAGATLATQAVVLTSRAWGHEGGNDITAEFVAASTQNAPLTVSTTGKDIRVSLATDAAGAPASTAAQVVAAINANGPAAQLLKATTYRGNAGAGIVAPRAKVNLSDFLTARDANGNVTNAHVPRGPYEYSVMRIGTRRAASEGPKVGVFLYCQQHAREWATPLTCLETAEQLLRNYAIDPQIRRLVDELDIFILPSSNPDGSHYSMYNFSQQRKNLTNHCVQGGKETDDPFSPSFWTPRANPQTGAAYGNNDPGSRDVWGTDLNRNNTFATLFDGYIGASHLCTSGTYTGPAEASEPEIRNELWIADTFPNIKFSNNIHSFGGYFMWAPGSYLPDRSEGEAVHANIGVEKYFFAAGDRILNRIKEIRNTVILPERTGPIADVLYSAAGNSSDEHWYNRDVIAYSFETGADRFVPTATSVAATAGQMGIRVLNRSGIDIGDKLVIGTGAGAETRVVASVPTQPNPPSPQPNVLFTEPLTKAHGVGVTVSGPTIQQAVGFQPDYATEGKFEAIEFAAGNIGLLESAYEYSRDYERPRVRMSGPKRSNEMITTTFEFVNEPSVIHYTTDGSRPTEDSPVWDSTGPREPGQTFELTRSTRFRWMATDIRGNVSYGEQRFTITRRP